MDNIKWPTITIHMEALLLQDIPRRLDKGNIGAAREIIGRQAMPEHDSREGAKEANYGP